MYDYSTQTTLMYNGYLVFNTAFFTYLIRYSLSNLMNLMNEARFTLTWISCICLKLLESHTYRLSNWRTGKLGVLHVLYLFL